MGTEKNNLLGIGANIMGEVIASTIPGLSIVSAVAGPIITDVCSRMLSSFEKQRVDEVSSMTIENVSRRLEAGEEPRRDDEFYLNDDYGQSPASKLLEETLLKCKQEFEKKKLTYYSNFWSNICFDNGVSYETANSIIGQFSALSYQQIKILILLNSGAIINIGKWEQYMFRNDTLAPYYTIYSDCLYLYTVRLAVQPQTQSKGIRLGTPEVCISPSGKLMCRLLELTLTDIEMSDIKTMIDNVDAIVDRLMREANDDGSGRILSPITEEDVNNLIEEEKEDIIDKATPKWK